MKKKPTVGQILFSLNAGNAARNVPQVLTPVKVTKVGNKYFTTGEGYAATQFHIDDWCEKTEYTPDHQLYESEQEYADENEAREICKRIEACFNIGHNVWNVSLDNLRKIDAILNTSMQAKQ